jgi:Secretion system C-terminal sorting domain
LSAQCNNDNERFDIFAAYTIQENINSEVEIVGGFEDRFYNSSHYRFNVTVSSAPLSVTNFTINFGNGGQPQTINFTQADLPITRSFNVDYATITDTKLVTVTSNPSVAAAVTLVQGFTPGRLTSRVQASSDYKTPTRTELVTGASFSPTCQGFLPTAKDAQPGSARIYMHTLLSPLNQTGHLRRPLIFLEGIDFDTKTRVCDPNVAGSDQTVHVGDFGWDNFITGVFEKPDDPDNETFGQLSTLTTQMLNEGYDLVFCDFVDGADWIQRNGLAVIAVIERVNADKRLGSPSGICFPNMVVGASMGGQVGKWALRTMELQGRNHDAALYVSFDSPQQGANIPLCVQSFIWFNATYGSEGDKASVAPRWNALNRPAAQQLLVHHFNKIEQTNGCDLRQLFAKEMVDLGYPLKTRNIGTANGSGFGTGQGYSSSALLSKFQGLAAINPTFATQINVFDAELFASGSPLISNVRKVVSRGWRVRPLPLSLEYAINYNRMAVTLQNSSAIQVSVFSQKETALPFPAIGNEPEIPIRIQNLTFNHDIRNWDNAPGGNRRDIRGSLKKSIKEGLDGNVFIDFPINIADAANTQTFIPSISALDIQTGQDNVNFNISAQLLTPTTLNSGVSPFSAIFFPTNNEGHVKITTDLGDFIVAQMNATQVTLQSPLAEPYNYGLIRTIIPSVTIASGGILGINNNGRTAYVNRPTSEAPTTKAVFTATATSGCDANIVVQSGGQIQLGIGWSNAGVLRISNGSTVTMEGSSTLQANNASQMIIERGGTLQLQENSTLKLFNTAQIIVESGGRLIINGGANINLVGSESTIYVKSGGELVINGNMVFSGNGFFQFDAGHILTLTNDLVLRGSGKTTRMIRLNSSPAPNPINNLTITGRNFTLLNALVEYGNRCQINVANGNNLNTISNSTFRAAPFGGGNSTALNFENITNANIQNCDFRSLSQGVRVNSAVSQLQNVDIGSSNFNLVNIGISIAAPTSGVAPTNRNLLIHDCIFNYSVDGIVLGSGTACRFQNLMQGVRFDRNTINGKNNADPTNRNLTINNSTLWENLTGIELKNASIRISGGRISDLKTGISAEQDQNNSVSLFQTTVEGCETGINILGGLTSIYANAIYGTVTMNCLRLVDNLTGIRGRDARLNANYGQNTFRNPAADGLLFDICSYNPAEDLIPVNANFWDGGFAAMRFNIFSGVGTCSRNTRLRLRQCVELLTETTQCLPVSGNCCHIISTTSTGLGTGVTGTVLQCLVANNTQSKPQISADKTIIGGKEVEVLESINEKIAIYPNPANETVQLKTESGNYTLKVSNTVGQTIFSQNTEGSLSVDVSTWTNGIYLFEVTDKATNKRQRSKIVVQH